jgi:hypothetical protein
MVRSLDSRRKNSAPFRKVLVGCIIMLFGVIQYLHARLSRSMNSYMRNLRHSHNAPHDIVASEADTTSLERDKTSAVDEAGHPSQGNNGWNQRYSHQNTNHHYAARGPPPLQQYHYHDHGASSYTPHLPYAARGPPPFQQYHGYLNNQEITPYQRARMGASKAEATRRREASQQRAQAAAHQHQRHHLQNHQQDNSHDNEDTAIIITSAWMPSHPSTYMIEKVINSTKLLTGLSPTAPIFITIDDFHLDSFNNLPSADQEERLHSLEQYTINLYNMFLNKPNVHIIPSMRHLHVGGSVVKAMNLIERNYPTVRYLYQLQHDYYFGKELDHTAMISEMKNNPDKLNYILFRNSYRAPIRPCGTRDQEIIAVGDKQTNKPSLIPTSKYSDNNHLVQFHWYKETIESIKSLARFPENPLQVRAKDACESRSGGMGLYVYSEPGMIVHLDGRNNKGA